MTKTILSAFTICAMFASITFSAQAQERSDKAMPVFIKKSEPLTKAMGWEQNKKSGKWIQNNNLISDMEVNPLDSANIGFTAQNIIWFRTATLGYEGKKYYVFYYYYLSGQYKYPETRVDWVPFPATRFIIMDSTKYFTFKKALLLKKGEAIKAKCRIANGFAIQGEYNETNILGAMAKEIKNETPTGTYCFTANAQTLNGKDIVRFRLPESCIFSDDLATEYFEISFDDFKKVFVE